MSESRPTNPQGHAPQGPSHPATTQPAGTPKISVVPTIKRAEADLEPLSLVDDPAAAGSGPAAPSKIKAFGTGAGPAAAHTFKRQTNVTGFGATRCRTFHGRLSEEGLDYMDNKINEWIDQHPEVEVKYVSTNIGQFEGKVRELALVVVIWY